MSGPLAVPDGASRRRRRAVMRGALAAVLLGSTSLVGACAPSRPPVPLDSPGDRVPVAPPPVAPDDEPIRRSTIEEEALPGGAPAAENGAPGDAFDLAESEPPLLETIDASTSANVAAATRLVDAARQHLAAGDTGSALDQLERALAIDPGNPYAYCYLAQLHLAHGSYDPAIAFAARAAALSSAAPSWASRAHTLRGNALEAAGRPVEARDAYVQALASAPDNLAARAGLARLGAPDGPP